MSEQPDRRKENDDDKSKGPEGSIPESEEGVGAGVTEEPSSFEPEEDPDAES